MGRDYYTILGIARNATDKQIKRAYRIQAIEHHPGRCKPIDPDDPNPYERFLLLGEAYDILGNPKTKEIYDQYGEEGLKEGAPGPYGFTEPYIYHGDSMKVYEEFFGTRSPYADLLDVVDKPLNYYISPGSSGVKVKDDPVYRDVLVTYEEMYNGCIKKMKVVRKVVSDDGENDIKPDEKILKIIIKPGAHVGTEYVFQGEGDRNPTTLPGDIIFVLKARKHSCFTREGLDLVLRACVSVTQALAGCVVNVKMLDGRLLHIPIVRVISPDYEKIVAKEGFPNPYDPTESGNLRIKFDTVFPKTLTNYQRNLVANANL